MAVWSIILLVISGIATAIKWTGGAIATLAEKFLEAARWIFDKGLDLYRHAYDLSPKLVKYLTLILFITFIGGIMTFFINFYFFCESGDLYQANSVVSGVTVFSVDLAYGLSGINRTNESIDELYAENTIRVNQTSGLKLENMMRVECKSNTAKLTLWGIDIFNPIYYILIPLIFYGLRFLFMLLRHKN